MQVVVVRRRDELPTSRTHIIQLECTYTRLVAIFFIFFISHFPPPLGCYYDIMLYPASTHPTLVKVDLKEAH
jgi:hypothetical protein